MEIPFQKETLFPVKSFVWMLLYLLNTLVSEVYKTEYVIVEDIQGLFAQGPTKYLHKSCSIEMYIRKQNQSKGVGFITASNHVTTEFAKM